MTLIKQINTDKIKKILCIKPRGIGDIVLSTIILENLKNYFINATIDYLTEDFAKEALSNNPFINKVISFNKKDFFLKVALKIRKEKYDIVFDLWSNPKTAQITFFSGIKYRVGYAYRGRSYAYNIKATASRGGERHSAEHNLEILKPLNIPIISKNIHYYCKKENHENAKLFLMQNNFAGKNIIGIIPSGGWESKRCPKEKWVEICEQLLKNFNVNIFILWGPGDEEDANFIKRNITERIMLIPETSIDEMSGYIKICSIIIANDSGPMHISAAMKIPTIGLFGPTNPKVHGPYGKNCFTISSDVDCIACNLMKCEKGKICFKEINTNEIISICKNYVK